MKITFIDLNPNILALKNFINFSSPNFQFEFKQGDILAENKDFISPGNSFGFLDGGLDQAITNKWGIVVQNTLQDMIKHKPMRELLVGETMIIRVNNINIFYAPTMRVPMILSLESINVYLAFKSAISKALDMNLREICVPLLGAGVGKLPLDFIGHQITQALKDVDSIYYPSNWFESSINHQKIYKNRFQPIVDLQTNNKF